MFLYTAVPSCSDATGILKQDFCWHLKGGLIGKTIQFDLSINVKSRIDRIQFFLHRLWKNSQPINEYASNPSRSFN